MIDFGLTALPTLSGLLSYIMVIVALAYALIFGYHWYQFGTSRKHVNRAMLIYLSVAIILLAFIFLAPNYATG